MENKKNFCGVKLGFCFELGKTYFLALGMGPNLVPKSGDQEHCDIMIPHSSHLGKGQKLKSLGPIWFLTLSAFPSSK